MSYSCCSIYMSYSTVYGKIAICTKRQDSEPFNISLPIYIVYFVFLPRLVLKRFEFDVLKNCLALSNIVSYQTLFQNWNISIENPDDVSSRIEKRRKNVTRLFGRGKNKYYTLFIIGSFVRRGRILIICSTVFETIVCFWKSKRRRIWIFLKSKYCPASTSYTWYFNGNW